MRRHRGVVVAAPAAGTVARRLRAPGRSAARLGPTKAAKTLSNADLGPSGRSSALRRRCAGRVVVLHEHEQGPLRHRRGNGVPSSVAGVVTKRECAIRADLAAGCGVDPIAESRSTQSSNCNARSDRRRRRTFAGDRKAAERTLVDGASGACRLSSGSGRSSRRLPAITHVPRAWIEPVPALTKNQPRQ